MLVRNITLPLINYLKFTSISSKSSYFYTPNLFSNNRKYLFSSSSQFNDNKNSQQTTTYMPIRPLKKNLTPLYVEKEYLNKG